MTLEIRFEDDSPVIELDQQEQEVGPGKYSLYALSPR